ncbi:MAG TPA: hypothetical protein G4O02_08090 [Caldilineae bacterium]|nr:hypothetical protein [Caldilineae bacterium]
MPLRIRDVVDIPPTTPLVVKVGEINDEERKAFHAREYVITDTVADCCLPGFCYNNLPFVA